MLWFCSLRGLIGARSCLLLCPSPLFGDAITIPRLMCGVVFVWLRRSIVSFMFLLIPPGGNALEDKETPCHMDARSP